MARAGSRLFGNRAENERMRGYLAGLGASKARRSTREAQLTCEATMSAIAAARPAAMMMKPKS